MKMTSSPVFGWSVTAVAIVSAFAALASAQVVTVPTTPQIGSSNPITAAPLVARPATKPCVVQLFQNLAFADFTPKIFDYALRPDVQDRGPKLCSPQTSR